MSIFSSFFGGSAADGEAPGAVQGAESDAELSVLQETIAELEHKLDELEERGWFGISDAEGFNFSREFVTEIVRSSRLHAIKHPTIKRMVKLYDLYVFGQGVSISGRGPVGEVIKRFLDHPQTKRAFSSHKARTRNNRTLVVDGNVFFRFFVNDSTGRVLPATVNMDQIVKPLRNPDNAGEIWFWLRRWWDASGVLHEELYPELAYRPTLKASSYAGYRIVWETPVYHLSVNDLDGMDFGVPEPYASIDWARAYKQHLEDWKKLVHSLTRYAWLLKTKGNRKAVAAAKSTIETKYGSGVPETNPAATTGATFVAGDDTDLAPLKTGGATITADDGRRLHLMSLDGFPETFFGDAQAGSLATAKSLDRPTELRFTEYQMIWGEGFADICDFVIDCAARAPNGLLRRFVVGEDEELGHVELEGADKEGDEVTRLIDVDWPPILQRDVEAQVKALVQGVTMGSGEVKLLNDARLLERLLLTYLGEDDVDEALALLHPADGAEPDTIPVTAPGPTSQTSDDDAATDARLGEALERAVAVLRELKADDRQRS